MNNIIRSIFICSNENFITKIFAQIPNYEAITIKSLYELSDISVNNKTALIIDSSSQQVNWKEIESVTLQLEFIILLYDKTDENLQQLPITLTIPIVYINMPFKFVKLISLLNYYLRTAQESIILSNNCSFSYNNKLLVKFKENKSITLTEKEASLLKFLYNAQGKPISKNKILERIWGYMSMLDTHTLETHIYRLRQKLGEDSYIIYTYEDKYGLKRHDFS
ncbi:MAG: helix-turn-helix domain-containing protein [Rickettsiales endosymbiont of Dermacentor nuttalli]